MHRFGISMRRGALRVLAAGALGGVVAATIALPSASAQPQCTAAGLSDALGTVSTATGAYLAAHPGANDVVTNAGSMSPQDGENSIRMYFAAHPQEWSDLQGIARPLANLRQQCNVDVAPAQIARLFDAMAS
ncbi:heme-binding protein [Mycobacterium sp.]|uniref:heme-binding protein n=1 Tax=Mycobacterium sp. TaxID=1785 RepID=UPI002D91F544|nr:heme-binding protein [Mycobacterium sp.]